jgi:VanZ family protein
MFWISAWFPVALGITVILFESTEFMGADHTTGPFRWLFQFFFGPVSDANWDNIHHYIRKSGHFIFYGLLGLAWLRAWWMTLPRLRYLQAAVLGLLGTALVASCDEWHQTFLPNRTGQASDVLLDCCGTITLELLVYIWFRLCKPGLLKRAA